MTLTLPEIKMTEGELKQELALSLYAARKVTLIQAVDIAGVGFFEFQGLLRTGKFRSTTAFRIWKMICRIFGNLKTDDCRC